MKEHAFIPYTEYVEYPPDEMKVRARDFYEEMRRRRTVRDFSERPAPREVIDYCIRTAGSAPSGANAQPWHFVVVQDPSVKRAIREAAEEEERAFYSGKAPDEWLQALAPLGTNERKPFLETAPYLIAVFLKRYDTSPDGEAVKTYYAQESVGIATGMLIAALHHAGLVTLTHTPSPMNFLTRILGRPENERPFVLIVTGFPARDGRIPNIGRRSLEEIVSYF